VRAGARALLSSPPGVPSVRLFRLFGIQFTANWSWLILGGLLVYAAYAFFRGTRYGFSQLELWALAVVAALLSIISLYGHELAHALVARRYGIPVRTISLFLLGGMAHITRESPSPRAEMLIALAGPATSLVIGIVAAIVGMPLWDVVPPVALLATWLAAMNIPLGIFNLVPAYPLDGGRVLRAFFSRRMDQISATRRAISIGRGFAIAFFLAGYSNPWFFVIGGFLFIAAQREDRSAVFQSVLDTVRLEDIMLTDFATLSPADTLEDALEKAVHCLQDDFPVIRGADMVGVVSKQKILQALRTEGNGYVQSVMNRMFDVSPKTETLASAFRKLSARNLSILPVVDQQQLVGIVTLQNLMHSMALLAETRKLRRAALE
jgi:Zn-dependent protease/CBS domain-containing protein